MGKSKKTTQRYLLDKVNQVINDELLINKVISKILESTKKNGLKLGIRQ